MNNRKLIQGRLNEISRFAEEFVEANGNNNLPIDPYFIAKGSGIKIIGDDFNQEFDGRAECINGKFIIFYDNTYGDQNPRTRFTIAHEIAHCEIQNHRQYLLSGGQPYSCKVDFNNEDQPEIEADTFASSLLLPRKIFSDMLNNKEPSMEHFINLSKKMNTSITSTILKGIELSEYPFSALKIKDSKISWAFHTKTMNEHGFTFIKKGTHVPLSSCVKNTPFKNNLKSIINGQITASKWFDNVEENDIMLWEEAIFIEATNEILLILTFQDYNDWK